jgi:L-lactate dehydrogenase complex protein LldG
VFTEDFMQRATAAGAECHLLAGVAGLASRIETLLTGCGVADSQGRLAVWAAGPVENLGHEAAALVSFPGLRLGAMRESAANALVGITAAGWGVAQTGTLILDSSDAAQRLASTLPEIHIALLWANRIVPSLGEALARMDPRRAPFIAAITGPSRTADIERVLTIGVHGPKRLIILIVQEGAKGDTQQ